MKLIRELLASKKFVTSLLGCVIAVMVKAGIPATSVDELLAIVSPFLAYVGAQGLADMGKEKAKAEAVKP